MQSYWRRHKALVDYQNLKKTSIIQQSSSSCDTQEEKVVYFNILIGEYVIVRDIIQYYFGAFS